MEEILVEISYTKLIISLKLKLFSWQYSSLAKYYRLLSINSIILHITQLHTSQSYQSKKQSVCFMAYS